MAQHIRNFQEIKIEGDKKINVLHTSFKQIGFESYFIRTFNPTVERQIFEGEALFLQYTINYK